MKAIKSFVMRDFFDFANTFFSVSNLVLLRRERKSSRFSRNEFDYSRRGTRTSVPHLDCRSCDNFGLLLAKIPIIWLGKKDQTEPPF